VSASLPTTARRAARRRWWYLVYAVIWLVGTALIGVPILGGLGAILSRLSLGARIGFYLMPPLLSAMLVYGVLQIIAMYRYWFGPR
jgi:hypothetical protein